MNEGRYSGYDNKSGKILYGSIIEESDGTRHEVISVIGGIALKVQSEKTPNKSGVFDISKTTTVQIGKPIIEHPDKKVKADIKRAIRALRREHKVTVTYKKLLYAKNLSYSVDCGMTGSYQNSLDNVLAYIDGIDTALDNVQAGYITVNVIGNVKQLAKKAR
jgi:hypothetical protein